MSRYDVEKILRGVPLSQGIAIGNPYIFSSELQLCVECSLSIDEVEREVVRYKSALSLSRDELTFLQMQLKEEAIDEGAAIIDAHLQMMEDPLLNVAVEEAIRKKRKSAESVFSTVIKQYKERFFSIKSPFFRERFKELEDLSRRIIDHIRGKGHTSLNDAPHGAVVIAKELFAADVAAVKQNSIAAFVTTYGGATSHAAIVAKAKGIPFVSGIAIEELATPSQNTLLIVDARCGEVIVNPSFERTERYRQLVNAMQTPLEEMKLEAEMPAETYDGYRIRLLANIERECDVDQLLDYGSEGIGLFRSEYIFHPSGDFPDEEEQYRIYRDIVERIKGLPVVIRTFDIGGDKQMLKGSSSGRVNPFLSVRALRYLLTEPTLFKSQLSAILRAAAKGDVSILFPMVSAVSELIEAKAILQEAASDLERRGVEYKKELPIGCMIEVPSAAITCDLIARECDFLSIGTNDLVQYSLAVDRSCESMQRHYTPTHPSVIRLIKMVTSEANHCGIPVSVCGEIAADPRFTPLLLGLGVHKLSLSPRYIPLIKSAIRRTSIVEACRLAEQVLSLATADEIEELLSENYRSSTPSLVV